MPTDTLRHKGLRKGMINTLIKKVGITDEKVLNAMNSVPRHFFLDSSLDEIAYEDRALQIMYDQTISQPSTVAFQTQLLNVSPRMKVLEIGTGSGYQTAILQALDLRVYTIERHKGLYEKAEKMFKTLNIHPQCFHGDGYKGLPGYAPFDRILVTCGAPQIPQDLLLQLKIGGLMVIPVGDKVQKMLRLTRVNEKEFQQEEFGNYTFVPMLENKTN
ncbi:MAG: protein-L-isoaspartate(D-aspartate) O-methyltransferase [Bacteroidales bacterium]|nr:protein-L-isoaspartate(D-aspartate) O-methyltransferase [Bacteroidales bacterium]